jgi:hypothetical protein
MHGFSLVAATFGHYVKQSSSDGERIRKVGEVLSGGVAVEANPGKTVSMGVETDKIAS